MSNYRIARKFQGLKKSLSNLDNVIRLQAIKSLAEFVEENPLYKERAIPLLDELNQAPDPEIRTAVADAIKLIEGPPIEVTTPSKPKRDWVKFGGMLFSKVTVGLNLIYFWYIAAYAFKKSVRPHIIFPILIMAFGLLYGAGAYEKGKSRRGPLTFGIVVIINGMFILWQEVFSGAVTLPGAIIITVGAIIFMFH